MIKTNDLKKGTRNMNQTVWIVLLRGGVIDLAPEHRTKMLEESGVYREVQGSLILIMRPYPLFGDLGVVHYNDQSAEGL